MHHLASLRLAFLLLALGLVVAACAPPRSRGGSGGGFGDDDDAVADDDDATDPEDQFFADNGWPVSHLPDDYESTGRAIGDFVPPFTGLTDQFGNADVDLGQFYGGMVLLNFGAVWCPPCNDAAANSQALHDALEGAFDEWEFFSIEILVDDAAGSGQATVQDGLAWAEGYGIDEPVLVGAAAAQLGNAWQITALPTFFVLDPHFQVRQIFEGYPGNGGLSLAIQDGWSAFNSENPDWEDPFADYPAE